VKNKITAILLLICFGCKYSNSNIPAKKDMPRGTNNKDTVARDAKSVSLVNRHNSVNLDYNKLTCDSLMILLINSSSIDKRVLKYRAGIDSIKNKIVYLSFSFIDKENGSSRNGYFLQVDLNKKQLIGSPDEVSSLAFDNKIMDCLVDRKCYNGDVDYVTPQ
jgi:hypothetical protein